MTVLSPPPARPKDWLVGRRPYGIIALIVALLASLTVVLLGPSAHAAGTPLSQGKPATASSVENAGPPARAAGDGNAGTRWSSAFSDLSAGTVSGRGWIISGWRP